MSLFRLIFRAPRFARSVSWRAGSTAFLCGLCLSLPWSWCRRRRSENSAWHRWIQQDITTWLTRTWLWCLRTSRVYPSWSPNCRMATAMWYHCTNMVIILLQLLVSILATRRSAAMVSQLYPPYVSAHYVYSQNICRWTLTIYSVDWLFTFSTRRPTDQPGLNQFVQNLIVSIYSILVLDERWERSFQVVSLLSCRASVLLQLHPFPLYRLLTVLFDEWQYLVEH